MIKKSGLIFLVILTACSAEPDDAARIEQHHENATKGANAMIEATEKHATHIDPFQELVNLGTYLEDFGLMRPASASDIEQVGYLSNERVPELIVFAREHPDWARPRLSLQTLEGEPALVLTFLSVDINDGMLTEVIPSVYAAGVHGLVPKRLVVRWVAHTEQLDSPLIQEEGDVQVLPAEVVKVSQGPGVSFPPWGTPLIYTQFFEQFGLSARPELTDVNFAVAIRATVSGEKSTSASTVSLAGGGTRVKINLPIDQGGTLWGPRSGESVTIYSHAAGSGGIECLIEL